VQKVPDTIVEEVLTELSAATADLAKSATIAVSRLVLRSRLSAAISDAGKAERAAEELRAAASIVPSHEQAGLSSESQGEMGQERAANTETSACSATTPLD
jgi:hypothetical protein